MNIPRPEHPNPQWQRNSWQNLNGTWQFGLDNPKLDREILVPFCPESELSGIGHTNFINDVYYQREFELSAEQLAGRVFVHFGAADYVTTVTVNGKQAGQHEGGYTSFSFDITDHVQPGVNVLHVHCNDNTQNRLWCSGKQSDRFVSYSCLYTRTTGIWQTVWLEFRPNAHVVSAVYHPDVENSCLHIEAQVVGNADFTATALWDGKQVGQATAKPCGGFVRLTLALSEAHLWEVGKGGLYDLKLQFGDDVVNSYFGLRSVQLDGFKFLINGKSVFQRLILDQGFYPDGIYTAPTKEALEQDILLSMEAGFNGARLHMKVFEPLTLYYADLHGYITWGEFANWGVDDSDPRVLGKFLPQWLESVARDRNHPSIVGWCPYNETSEEQYDDNISVVYEATKALDPSRPCIDTSGYVHVKTDIYCVHEYGQDAEQFASRYAPFIDGDTFFDHKQDDRKVQKYAGEAMFVSEYGGIAWNAVDGWGYGEAPKTEEEYKARYAALTTTLIDHPKMFGFCYTQLTDVEQEKNGVFTYDRQPKFELSFFRDVNTKKAAIED
ncbi:MAG: beta-galactosidase [Oscillospiraceae bacterium]|nr:beta-galactosidase [Oscillospiraceae bacterium]